MKAAEWFLREDQKKYHRVDKNGKAALCEPLIRLHSLLAVTHEMPPAGARCPTCYNLEEFASRRKQYPQK